MELEKLLEILACPKCKGDLQLIYKENNTGFKCTNCQIIYPVCEGLPVMLIEKAIPLSKWEE